MSGPRRASRELHLCLDLLDRQLLDRHGRECGNVDDVELELNVDGEVYVTALLTGPGALAPRLGRRRLGMWLYSANTRLCPSSDGRDRSRVPIELATEIGPAIRVALDADGIAASDLERWTRTAIIDRIPGARHASE